MSSSSGGGTARRPMGFFGPFNKWWSQFFLDNGRRPAKTDIELWRADNRSWRPELTVEDIVQHSKGRRDPEKNRQYFVEYRRKMKAAAKKPTRKTVRRGGGGGSGGARDEDDEEDEEEEADEDEEEEQQQREEEQDEAMDEEEAGRKAEGEKAGSARRAAMTRAAGPALAAAAAGNDVRSEEALPPLRLPLPLPSTLPLPRPALPGQERAAVPVVVACRRSARKTAGNRRAKPVTCALPLPVAGVHLPQPTPPSLALASSDQPPCRLLPNGPAAAVVAAAAAAAAATAAATARTEAAAQAGVEVQAAATACAAALVEIAPMTRAAAAEAASAVASLPVASAPAALARRPACSGPSAGHWRTNITATLDTSSAASRGAEVVSYAPDASPAAFVAAATAAKVAVTACAPDAVTAAVAMPAAGTAATRIAVRRTRGPSARGSLQRGSSGDCSGAAAGVCELVCLEGPASGAGGASSLVTTPMLATVPAVAAKLVEPVRWVCGHTAWTFGPGLAMPGGRKLLAQGVTKERSEWVVGAAPAATHSGSLAGAATAAPPMPAIVAGAPADGGGGGGGGFWDVGPSLDRSLSAASGSSGGGGLSNSDRALHVNTFAPLTQVIARRASSGFVPAPPMLLPPLSPAAAAAAAANRVYDVVAEDLKPAAPIKRSFSQVYDSGGGGCGSGTVDAAAAPPLHASRRPCSVRPAALTSWQEWDQQQQQPGILAAQHASFGRCSDGLGSEGAAVSMPCQPAPSASGGSGCAFPPTTSAAAASSFVGIYDWGHATTAVSRPAHLPPSGPCDSGGSRLSPTLPAAPATAAAAMASCAMMMPFLGAVLQCAGGAAAAVVRPSQTAAAEGFAVAAAAAAMEEQQEEAVDPMWLDSLLVDPDSESQTDCLLQEPHHDHHQQQQQQQQKQPQHQQQHSYNQQQKQQQDVEVGVRAGHGSVSAEATVCTEDVFGAGASCCAAAAWDRMLWQGMGVAGCCGGGSGNDAVSFMGVA